MNALLCPFCDAALPRREAAEGWCETCGKKLPVSVVDRAKGGEFARVGGAGGAGATAGGAGAWTDSGARWVGLFHLAWAALTSWVAIYSPLQAAAHQESSVSFSWPLIVMTPVGFGFGLAMLLFGERAGAFLGSSRQLSPAGWLCALGLMAVGLLIAFLMRGALAGYGYAV